MRILAHILRTAVLLGLVCLFAASLATRSLDEARRRYPADPHWDRVPGLRVLIGNPDTRRDTHTKVKIIALQALELVCPDDPELSQEIPQGFQVEIIPGGREGIVVYVKQLDLHQKWAVPQINVIPVERTAISNMVEQPSGAQVRLRQIEARNREASHELLFDGHKRAYRGSLKILPKDAQRLYAINVLPLEAYVEGMLEGEMSGSWPSAALRAQAIAGRSYAYAAVRTRRRDRWDLTDGGADPTYRGTAGTPETIRAAASETHGQILTVSGDPFQAHFHASSGGYTASIDDLVEGATTLTNKLPLSEVMVARPDPFCRRGVELTNRIDSHWQREEILPTDDLRAILERHGLPGWTNSIQTERHASGRVKKVFLKIWNPNTQQFDNDLQMTGQQFRELIGVDRIRSTFWSDDSPMAPDIRRDSAIRGYTFITTGWGHGVGLSQVSAYAMAIDGYAHQDILNFFYRRTQIDKHW